MAIAFVAAGTGAEASSGNISPTMPATVNADDVAILVWWSDDNVTASLPGGWTIVHQANSSFGHGGWAWKRCNGTEDGASVTLTHAAGGGVAARIVTYSGVTNSGAPYTVAPTSSVNTTTDATIECATLTPIAGETVVYMGGLDDVVTFTAPTGTDPTFTERMEMSGAATHFASVTLGDGTSTGAAVGARTITASGGTGPSIGWLVALTPDNVATFAVAADADDGGGFKTGSTWPISTFGGNDGDTGGALVLSKYFSGGTYAVDQGFARWDTSSIPDTATITSATLSAYCQNIADGSASRSFGAVWYDFGGEPTVAADIDPDETFASSVITKVRLNVITSAAENTFTVTDFTGINKTGWTGVRMGVDGGQPTADDEFSIRNHENGTPFVTLTVHYRLTGSSAPPPAPTIRTVQSNLRW